MDFNRGLALLFVLLAISIHNSNSYCANGMFEKVSLSLAANTKRNFALVGFVFETFSSQFFLTNVLQFEIFDDPVAMTMKGE